MATFEQDWSFLPSRFRLKTRLGATIAASLVFATLHFDLTIAV